MVSVIAAALTTAAARSFSPVATELPTYLTTSSDILNDNRRLMFETKAMIMPRVPKPTTPSMFAVTMLSTALMALLRKR